MKAKAFLLKLRNDRQIVATFWRNLGTGLSDETYLKILYWLIIGKDSI